MSGKRSDELLLQLKEQGLIYEEIESKLNAIIDGEQSMPKGWENQDLIDACVDLQWFLATGEHYKSNRAKAKEKLDAALSKYEERKRERRKSLATVACTVCLAALLFVLPVNEWSLHRVRINGETVGGGEIYRLNGEEVTPGLVKQAIAEIERKDISIVTSDYKVFSQSETVGRMHPQYVPQGWEIDSYNYSCIENVVYYSEKYHKAGEDKELSYQCIVYPDVESVVDDIQQNNSGDLSVIGNREVYYAENYDMSVAIWSDELTYYSIFAPLEYEEISKMINSIEGV